MVIVKVLSADFFCFFWPPGISKSAGRNASGAVWKLTSGGFDCLELTELSVLSLPLALLLGITISLSRQELMLVWLPVRLEEEKLLVMLAMLNFLMT